MVYVCVLGLIFYTVVFALGNFICNLTHGHSSTSIEKLVYERRLQPDPLWAIARLLAWNYKGCMTPCADKITLPSRKPSWCNS